MEGRQEFLVRALYSFSSANPGDLSANEGDVITVLAHHDEHWYNGELNGKTGLFPITYAERIEPKWATAAETYTARRPGEISFTKGDKIKVLEEVGTNWLRGELNGSVGIFPSIFAEMNLTTEEEESDDAIYSNSEFYENLDITFAEALYGFEARTSEELSFPMGAELVVRSDVDSDWYEGTFEGQTGLFPKSYVKLLDSPSEISLSDTTERPCARSIYPFVGESDSELTFKEGELIYLRRRAGSQWLEGEVNNNVGRFPASFVDIVIDLPPEKDTLKSDVIFHTSRHIIAPEKVQWTEVLKARALYHFSALHPGDLALNEGDIIAVLKVVDDNWLEGRLDNGCSGACPVAYLEPVGETQHSQEEPPKTSMFMELKAGIEARESKPTGGTSKVSNNLVNGNSNSQMSKVERTLLDSSFSEDLFPVMRLPSSSSEKSSLPPSPSTKPKPAPRPPSISTSQRSISSRSSSQSSVGFDSTSPTASGLPSPLAPTHLATTSSDAPIYSTVCKPPKGSSRPTKPPAPKPAVPAAPRRFFPPVNDVHVDRQMSSQAPLERTLLDSSVSSRASVFNLSAPLVPLPSGEGTGSGMQWSIGPEEPSAIVPRRKAPPPPKKCSSVPNKLHDYKSSKPQDGQQGKQGSRTDKVDSRTQSVTSPVPVERFKQQPPARPEMSPKKRPPPPPPARLNKNHFGQLGRSATVSATSREEYKKTSPKREPNRTPEGGKRRQRPYSVYYVGGEDFTKDKLNKSNSLEDVRPSQAESSNIQGTSIDPNEGMINQAYVNTDDVPGVTDLDKTIAEAEKNLQVEKRAFTGMTTISQMLIHDEAKFEEMKKKMSRSQQKIDEWQGIIVSLKDERTFMIDSYFKRKKLDDQMSLLGTDLEKQLRSQKSLEVLLGVVEESRKEEVLENLSMCEGIISDLNTQMKNMEDSMQTLTQRPTQSTQHQMAEQRKKVVTELLTTEQDFIRDLQMCIQYFYEALKHSKVVEADVLFGNMQAVVQVSQRLQSAFERAVKDKEVKQQELGKCFVDNAEDMKYVYSVYCRNHDDAIALLEKYEEVPEAQEAFGKCLNAIRDTTKCWDLSSFLIKPVQRVLKYPLLLSQLLKCTPQIHKDKDNLLHALSAMTEVATAINEVKRRKDLVVKYKRVEESGISNKFQKLSWHSVIKKSSRFTQRITQSTGLVLQTVDKIFNEEEKKFNGLEKTLKNLIKNVTGYVEQFQDAVTRQEATGENIQDYYNEASTCTEVTMYHSTQQRISGVLLDAFMTEVLNRVLTPLTTLLLMFQGPQRLIQKRHDKCLDYDSWSNKIEKIKDKEKDKLKQAKDGLESARRNYEALNAQLLEELPLFREKTMSLMKDCILNFAQAKRTFHAVILGEYTNLMLLPLVKDGDEDIIEHQSDRTAKVVETLADLNFIPASFSGKEVTKKKRGSHKHQPPAKPPAPDTSLNRKRMAPPPPPAPTGVNQRPERPMPVPRKNVPGTPQTQQGSKVIDTTPVSFTPYIVVCTFEAQNAGEVSVNEGDLVSVQRQSDTSGNPEWWLVSCSGATGYVPGDFVEPYEVGKDDDDEDEGIDNGSDDVSDDADDPKLQLPGTSPKTDAMTFYAQFDFEGTSEAELTIDEGQLVTVLKQHDLEGNSEWWLVEAEGKKGYVAANFLAPLAD